MKFTEQEIELINKLAIGEKRKLCTKNLPIIKSLSEKGIIKYSLFFSNIVGVEFTSEHNCKVKNMSKAFDKFIIDEEPKIQRLSPINDIKDYTILRYTQETINSIKNLAGDKLRILKFDNHSLVVSTDNGDLDLKIDDYLIKNEKTGKLGVITNDGYNIHSKLESYFLLNLAP